MTSPIYGEQELLMIKKVEKGKKLTCQIALTVCVPNNWRKPGFFPF